MNEKVIYFSLNSNRKQSFYKYVRQQRICYAPKFSFALEGETDVFYDPRDLITVIERNEKKGSLHIIIDYVSCCGTGQETNYSEAIRDIIMCYPEVQFLFDETFVRKSIDARNDARNRKYNFMNFLFWEATSTDVMNNVLAEFHQFEMKFGDEKAIKEQFIRLLKGCINLYDGSNLRHAIKEVKRNRLSVESNYKKLQESRSTWAAVVVEEEYHQNMFNSYCLYANGFRVFPIVSATELLWINKTIRDDKVKRIEAPLLIRDYDLQFVDEDRVNSGVAKGDKSVDIGGQPYNFYMNEIDFIRGAKYIEIEKDEKELREDKKKYILVSDVAPYNPYWDAFDSVPKYFVSKGGKTVSIKKDYGQPIATEDEQRRLCLKGIEKPLEGIFASFRDDIKEVRERYDESRDVSDFVTKRTNNSGHSCPLDIYGITRSMVQRAETYYQNGCNRLAALLAGEALEVLNGFHKSLMYKAYYLQAVAENAMAMSLLGGDEGVLRRDVKFRLKQKVIKDVERMMPGDEEYRYNLLYNIFNDCMLFCQQKEYFEAADEALSVMVHEKEGISPARFVNILVEKVGKIAELFRKLFKNKDE